MSDIDAVNAVCDSVTGPFDVLINNAGLPRREGNQIKLLSVNVFDVLAMTRAILPKLAKGARVVNTASRAGLMWQENIDEV